MTKDYYMRCKDDYTPSTYDINGFNIDNIPSNIDYHDVCNLTKIINSKSPITKKILLNLENSYSNPLNNFTIGTNINVYEKNKYGKTKRIKVKII